MSGVGVEGLALRRQRRAGHVGGERFRVVVPEPDQPVRFRIERRRRADEARGRDMVGMVDAPEDFFPVLGEDLARAEFADQPAEGVDQPLVRVDGGVVDRFDRALFATASAQGLADAQSFIKLWDPVLGNPSPLLPSGSRMKTIEMRGSAISVFNNSGWPSTVTLPTVQLSATPAISA